MTAVLEQYQHFIHGGDPNFREFFFAKSVMPMATIVTTYVFFVTVIGPALMRDRKPFQIRKLIIFYNFALVAYYIYFLIKGVYYLYNLGFSTFCDNQLDTSNPFVASFYYHGYELYLVRTIELADTVFLVLTKKFNMVTRLHVFHHAIVPVFGWLYLRSEKGTYLSICMGINCFVHIIMYTYYAVAALGPEYRKYLWWKKYLTGLQITQFLVMTIYLLTMYAIGCVTSKLIVVFSVFLTVLFFFLFINYYRNTFKQRPEDKNIYHNGSILTKAEKLK